MARRIDSKESVSAEDSPIAWFGEMLLAIDRGDLARASDSRRELDRLGWSVRPKSLDVPMAGPSEAAAD